ncbi:MAG: PAS domain-containing protein, partial [Microbacteriaceae bacterium]|nr:PAS domain-containing protein [Burkholderiaceae bacterium]
MPLLPRHATLPSNAQLAALLDGVDEVLLLLDARQRVSFCNRAAQQLLGCEPGQPLDRALAGLTEPARHTVRAALLALPGGGPPIPTPTPTPPPTLMLQLARGPAAGRRLPFALCRGATRGWGLGGPPPAPAP